MAGPTFHGKQGTDVCRSSREQAELCRALVGRDAQSFEVYLGVLSGESFHKQPERIGTRRPNRFGLLLGLKSVAKYLAE